MKKAEDTVDQAVTREMQQEYLCFMILYENIRKFVTSKILFWPSK